MWGSSRCAGLLNRGGRRILFLGKLPPRAGGATHQVMMKGGSCFCWGSSRRPIEREEAVSGEARAARGCSNDDEGRKLFLEDKLLIYCADGCSMAGGRSSPGCLNKQRATGLAYMIERVTDMNSDVC